MTVEQVRELFPSRAPNVQCENAGDEIRLTVSRAPSRLAGVLSFLYRLPLKRTYVLDQFGARVWKRCDGRTPAREIVISLSRQTGWPEERTERAVLQFLSTLSQRRLVGFSASRAER